MKPDQQITLTLTIDEARLVVEGLGEMPYQRVYALIPKIQQQAKLQVGDGDGDGDSDTAPETAPKRTAAKSSKKAKSK